MSGSSILLYCIVAMLFVAECSAIQCAECFSASDSDCMDNPDKYKVDCALQNRNVSCQKILQKLEGDTGYRVTRQCSSVSRFECIERVGTRGVRAWYCHCNDKDMCNGSSQLSVAFSSLLLVAIALVLANFDR